MCAERVQRVCEERAESVRRVCVCEECAECADTSPRPLRVEAFRFSVRGLGVRVSEFGFRV